jgi:hypothetical protein
MDLQQRIAQILDAHITWERDTSGGYPYPWERGHGYPPRPRPSAEELGRELLGIAEFEALRLGTWLGTTDGRVFTEAVELVTPPFYGHDVELLVAALRYAAEIQHQRGQRVAGGIALTAVAGIAGYAYAVSKAA